MNKYLVTFSDAGDGRKKTRAFECANLLLAISLFMEEMHFAQVNHYELLQVSKVNEAYIPKPPQEGATT